MLELLEEIEAKKQPPVVVDNSVLKPGLQLIVANNLEVSRCSSITCIELLRRHQPDATRWTNFVGLRLDVDEDDFKAIARSALSGGGAASILKL